jgi:AraC-like DNA-binding protein
VNLRPTDVVLYDGGDPVHDGPLPAGSVVLVAAGRPASAAYRAPCDLLQLFVPVELLEGLAGDYALPPFGVLSSPDPAVGRLALSLLAADELEGRAADLYSKGVAAAIVARLFGRAPTPAGLAAPARQGLLKWRLRRVFDYIEANLSEPMTLPDLAAAAGLSRMHFASQFRAATGMRPHDFVMRRRIERAEELLRDTALPLVEVALSVGFQTQAHFTTVFRALVLETPGRWRKLQLH